LDYPIKTLSQLKPILQAFRRSRGLTQAAVAERLGVTQQSYAQLEANPAAASVDRLFRALSLLHVELKLGDADQPYPQGDAQKDALSAQSPVATYTVRPDADSAKGKAPRKSTRPVAPKRVDTGEDW
jgi:HTH-type transcriptional regulator / antitoxin HipB